MVEIETLIQSVESKNRVGETGRFSYCTTRNYRCQAASGFIKKSRCANTVAAEASQCDQRHLTKEIGPICISREVYRQPPTQRGKLS